jgi:hypothetical protein
MAKPNENEVKTHKANNPEPIPERFIVFDPGWTNSIEQAAWLNFSTVEEWREKFRVKYSSTF